jgi:hypothetical protein
MNLALAIVFLWTGCALLYVAFHPLAVESGRGSPAEVLRGLQTKVANEGSAYAQAAPIMP